MPWFLGLGPRNSTSATRLQPESRYPQLQSHCPGFSTIAFAPEGLKLIYSDLSAPIMDEQRLGDVIDDHCVKCRRITNHSIVSLVDGKAAKVRCRTCYHDHDFRLEQAPPSKKDLKSM